MPDEFISEAITPERGSFSTELMTEGLASLPGAFTWRDRRYEIVECLAHHKVSEREACAARGELYLRRQVFEVRLDTGERATIYLLRQPGSGKSAKKRWFLYTLGSGD